MTRSVWLLVALLAWQCGCDRLFAAEAYPLAACSAEDQRPLSAEGHSGSDKDGMDWRDPETDQFLKAVAERLWRHVSTDLAMIRVQVIQDAIPDAKAYADGRIVITTGMLCRTRSEDQVAMLLSHEITHYVRRHGLEVLSYTPTAPARQGEESRRDLIGFREEAEAQADREGLLLMKSAGYCPQEVLPLVNRVPAVAGNGSGRGDAYSWETAAAAARMARIQVLIDALPTAPPCQPATEPSAYTVRIAPVFLANAQAALRQGLPREGSEAIQRYLAVRPEDPQAHYIRGEIEGRLGPDARRAMDCYQRAISLDPGFAPAYRALGVIHLKAGELGQARQCFETSLALSPQAAENDYIRGYLQLCSP